jgi:hypothetical protein
MEDYLKKKMEDNLKTNKRRPQNKWKTTSKRKWKMTSKKDCKNGRQPQKNGMEDDLKHNFKKSTLIGCDIIVN